MKFLCRLGLHKFVDIKQTDIVLDRFKDCIEPNERLEYQYCPRCHEVFEVIVKDVFMEGISDITTKLSDPSDSIGNISFSRYLVPDNVKRFIKQRLVFKDNIYYLEDNS